MLYKLTRKDDAARGNMQLKPIQRVPLSKAGWVEKDLENYMAENLPVLLQEEELMPIFQEPGGPEQPDILAVNQEGTLYIFELKRWEAKSENLLQVLRYGQKYGRYHYNDLNELYKKYRRKQKADEPDKELRRAHAQEFGLTEESEEGGLDPSKFNRTQRFVVVTAGLDMDTVQAIHYWNEQGLPIEAKVFRVYKLGEQFLFEFDPYAPPEAAQYYQAETHNYVVNTNDSWDKDAYKYMITESCAAAYRGRKTAVDSIQKNDRVFLYHTGLGMIATGKAKDSFRVSDFQGETDALHYVPCEFDIILDPGRKEDRDRVVSAREINQALGTGYKFRQTTFSISDEKADKIEELLREKNEPL